MELRGQRDRISRKFGEEWTIDPLFPDRQTVFRNRKIERGGGLIYPASMYRVEDL